MTPSPSAVRVASDKTVVACDRCKAKKIKCGGTSDEDCPVCIKANVPCSYRKIGRKRMFLEEDVEELKAQIEDLEARIAELQSEQSTHETESELVIPAGEEIKEDYNSMFNGMETLFVSPSGEHTFVGPGAATFLASKLGDKPQNLSWEFYPQDEGDETWWRRPPSPTLMQLPRPAVARHLYHSQYVYIGTIFAFAQRKHFEARLEHFAHTPPDPRNQESCLGYCQLLLVYAYGELYSVNQWTSEGPPGLHFFRQALKYLPGAHEPGSVLFVEVLSMVGYYLQVLNRRDAAFLYIGMALRMAISLGLHQELGPNSSVSVIDREHRRRVWWSVYSMDRIISVKSGNPITIHDGDIGVNWPMPLKELDGTDLSVALVLSSYSKLSKILGKIGEDIYRRRHTSGTTLLKAIQTIMNDLSAWWRNRPAELKINPTTMHLDLSREAVSTYLHFYQCVNMTIRPLLFAVTQNRLRSKSKPNPNQDFEDDWKTGLPAIVVSNIESSITAAGSTAQITSAALNRNLLATYGFMDGEHAFSSALTLVMANIALDNNPANSSAMETALQVLRAMAEKGNRYVEYRLLLLQNLSSTIPSQTQIRTNAQRIVNDGNAETTFASHEHVGLNPSIPLSPVDAGSPSTSILPSLNTAGTTTSAGQFYNGSMLLQDHFSILPDFLQPIEMQDPDINFDMNIDPDDVDAHMGMGFLDDQGWIENTQHLQEQIYE